MYMSQQTTTTKMLFMSVPEFKAAIKADVINIVKNPKGEKKLFVDAGNGRYFRCQQAIDLTKPIKFMYESNELFNDGCITNVTDSANILASL